MAGVLRVPLSRSLTTTAVARSSHAASAGEHGDYKLWKRLSFFVAFPAIGLGMVNCYLSEHEHPPEFHAYEHLRVRTKRFPWGDGNKSLFHNKHTNPLPDGYEQ